MKVYQLLEILHNMAYDKDVVVSKKGDFTYKDIKHFNPITKCINVFDPETGSNSVVLFIDEEE